MIQEFLKMIKQLSLPFFAFLLLWASPAFAFYASEEGALSQEARGLWHERAGLVDSDTVIAASARLMYDLNWHDWHMEYHQVWQKVFSGDHAYQTQADRLNISMSNETIHLKLGRQAVNLATTFYFSPNDFFAPFSLQTFNRDYKTGVDALYAEMRLGELSQVTGILVNNHDESLPTSSILRFESAFDNVSWMMLAGEINSQGTPTPFNLNPADNKLTVVGGSIQTDIFDTIGIRAEVGHQSNQEVVTNLEWVLGLEYYANADLTLTTEWFHHGAKAPTALLPYTASAYMAIGASYTFTPLLSGSFSGTFNIDDDSQLYSVYLNYSLSNESTISFYALQPSEKSTTTEFGNYLPVTGLELLFYF